MDVTTGAGAGDHVWHRATLGWHLVFAMFAVVTTVLVVLEDISATRRAVAVALIAVLAAWYVATGRRGMQLDPPVRPGEVYVWVAIPLVVLTMIVTLAGSVLLFGMYPQVWTLLGTRRAVVASVLLTVAVGLVIAIGNGLTAEAVGAALLIVLLGSVVSILLGLWITRIIDQSRQRAELVRDLEATRAELATVSHDAGVLAERERLARDLHDSVAQGFTSTLILLQAAQAELRRDPTVCAAHLALAEQATRENLAEVRALVAAMTPVALTDGGLPAALERITERLGRELGISATMTVQGAHRPLPSALEVVLLRSTQEALANVRKHAGASAVQVLLRYRPEGVALRVADDGRGLDPAAKPGFGLQGLRERVAATGGTLRLDTGPGVTVQVDLPVAVP